MPRSTTRPAQAEVPEKSGQAAPGARPLPVRDGGPKPHPLEGRQDPLDLTFDAVFVRGLHDRVITSWNRGAEEMYGWTCEEAVGRSVPDLLEPDYPQPIAEVERQLLQDGLWEGQLTHKTRDGTAMVVAARWVVRRDGKGAPTGVLEINRDVTVKVQTEERLQENEETFQLLVSGAREYAIFRLDTQGRVMTWNDGARHLTGYPADEIIGRHYSAFFPEEAATVGQPDWHLVLAEQEGRLETQGWRVRKDGSRFWADVLLTPLHDKDGKLSGFGKLTRDVTERMRETERKAEHQHQEAERLKQHADRMAELEKSKSEFLNLASHELRGPIALLRGYIEMFRDGSLSAEQTATVLPLMAGKLHQMTLLVNQMLETARIEDDRLALDEMAFDVREAVQATVRSFEPLARRKHELTLTIPQEPVVVVGDRARLETVVSNLVDNALKFSPDGGPVNCLVAASTNRVFISVQDAGLGIEEHDLPKLFTRFGRLLTKDNSHINGTGLGLYLCREIARRTGGDILVESRPGRGSRFTLMLPRRPDQPG